MKQASAAVEALFTTEGEIVLRRFEWQGGWLTVEGVGRRWAEAGERCFNVTALDGRLFELRFDPETLRWSVARGPIPRLAV
jgi:hypothetical protein